jgi:putative heme iron utilization protein
VDETESLRLSRQKPTAARLFEKKSGVPGGEVKSSWYQIRANQRLIPQETKKWMAKPINARRTITMQTSHASVATRPDKIVKLIAEATSALAA